MKTFAKKFAWGLSYTIAIFVILAATLVSVSRMMTPYLNGHVHDFEAWASEQLKAPVSIDQVHITWYYYQPVLTFEQVAILDQATHKPNFNIQQIKVNLQILPSLLHWKPIPQYIKIFGANLTLREQTSGQMSVEGVGQLAVIDNIAGGKVKANMVVAWILSQPHLVLDDINLKYIPLHDTEKSITLDKLSLVNDTSTHELSGNAILNQDIPMDVQVKIQVKGDVTDLPHVAVHAYFYLEGVSLPQWFKERKWDNLQLEQGLGSAKIWMDWDQNQLQKISSELQIYDLEIKSLLTNKILDVTRVNGRFGWMRDGENQIYSGEDILIDFPEHLWPSTGFSVKLVPAADGALGVQSLRIDYLDLADTLELASASGFVPEKIEKLITEFDPNGDLNALSVKFAEPFDPSSFLLSSSLPRNNGQVARKNDQVTSNNGKDNSTIFLNNTISVDFSKLSFNAWQNLPGVDDLSGKLTWNGQQGDLTLNSQKASFNLDNLFVNPLRFDQLNGDISFQKDEKNNWTLTGKNIQISNEDLTAKANFSLLLPQNDSPTIDLTSDFSMLNTTHIDKYIPVKILDPVLAHWLRNTFYGGTIPTGNILLQGRLSDFPFDKAKGKFLVVANVNDLDFEFAPKWPGIKHLNGKLIFAGHTMTADVISGQMDDIALQQVHAEIPYIGADQPQILNLKSIIHADLTQALQYIQNSPLEKTLGKDLAAMKLTGPITLNLSLSIPLKTPEKTVVVGDMTIPQAELNLPEWNLKLEQLSGALHFTDNDIKATNVQAKLLGEPIALNIDSTHTAKTPPTVSVTFQSKISKAALQTWFKVPSTNLFQGTTNYTAQLNLTSDEQSKPSQFIISSDLKGMTVNLPEIYGKKADEARDFQFLVNMGKQNQGLQIKVTYGNLLSTAITLQKNHGETQFYSGELRLGSGAAVWQTKPGLLITGQFDKWDLTTWENYLSQLSQSTKPNQEGTGFDINMLRGIDLSAKQLSAFGMNLHSAHVQAMQDPSSWSINLSSTEMTGQISVPDNHKQTIQAKFQHLYLVPMTGTGESTLDPKTLPPISFVGNDVRYKGMGFGTVSLNTVPTPAGLLIQSLHCNSQFYNLNANGEWRSQKNNSKTTLQGNIDTKDVGKLLNEWGMKASNIVESGGTLQFNLNWSGAPYNPQMSTIIGDLSLKLTAGRVIDLSNSADAKMGIGKVLNIFNLSSIPRRLTLNFSDFEKGYSFDSMQGHFTLKNGSAFTDDTRFDGPIARIEIGGRIGYVAKDYDVNFSVTPYGMTSSLPLVATMVGGPIAGAATWVVEKVVGSAVSSATTHHYTVRGSWSNPQWNEK